MLRTSSFVDDITFPYNGLYGMSCVFLSVKSITAETTASVPTMLCLTIRIDKYT